MDHTFFFFSILGNILDDFMISYILVVPNFYTHKSKRAIYILMYTSCQQYIFIVCIIIMYCGTSNRKILIGIGGKILTLFFKHLNTNHMNYKIFKWISLLIIYLLYARKAGEKFITQTIFKR